MTTEQTKALELAQQLGRSFFPLSVHYLCHEAASELRRLAAIEAERDTLRAELEAIRALEPVAWIGVIAAGKLRDGYPATTTMTKRLAFLDDVALYTLPAQKDRT